jgi:hypothetical protein
MGFQDGWGKAIEQLIEHMKTVRLWWLPWPGGDCRARRRSIIDR